jgi:hypothetical protein
MARLSEIIRQGLWPFPWSGSKPEQTAVVLPETIMMPVFTVIEAAADTRSGINCLALCVRRPPMGLPADGGPRTAHPPRKLTPAFPMQRAGLCRSDNPWLADYDDGGSMSGHAEPTRFVFAVTITTMSAKRYWGG